jgi:hypothetical protein
MVRLAVVFAIAGLVVIGGSGCSEPPAGESAAAITLPEVAANQPAVDGATVEQILGFEDVRLWSGAEALRLSTVHSEGSFSLAVRSSEPYLLDHLRLRSELILHYSFDADPQGGLSDGVVVDRSGDALEAPFLIYREPYYYLAADVRRDVVLLPVRLDDLHLHSRSGLGAARQVPQVDPVDRSPVGRREQRGRRAGDHLEVGDHDPVR